MATSIYDTGNKRSKLKPRPEPYWQSLTSGLNLGYYVGSQANAWRVRARVTVDGKKKYEVATLKTPGHNCDAVPDVHDAAVNEAMKWHLTRTKAVDHTLTVAACMDSYVDNLELKAANQQTAKSAASQVSSFKALLGGVRLADLNQDHIEQWQAESVAGKSGEALRKSKATSNRKLKSVKAALNFCHRAGRVKDKTAWQHATPFKDANAPRQTFITDDEVTALLQAAEGDFRNFLLAAIYTAGRTSELREAKVRDFDEQHHAVLLSSRKGKGGEIRTRKTFVSKKATDFFARLVEDKSPDAPLLSNNGEQWPTSFQSRLMQVAVKTAGLRSEITLYSLRHYSISKALIAGLGVAVVAKNTGTSVEQIMDTYLEILPSDAHGLIDRVELADGDI